MQAGLSLALVGSYAAPYAVRAHRLRARGRPVPVWRIACFASGAALLALAVSPPVDQAADRRLSAHMLEHLALGDVAPLLLVLGLTRPLIAPLLRVPGVWRARRRGHAVVAVALWAAALYAWNVG